MKRPQDFDMLFRGFMPLQVWLRHMMETLLLESTDNAEVAAKGADIARQFLELFPQSEPEILVWFRRHQAQFTALTGQCEEAEAMLAEMTEDNDWDAYFALAEVLTSIREKVGLQPDYERALTLLGHVSENCGDAVVSIDADDTIAELKEKMGD